MNLLRISGVRFNIQICDLKLSFSCEMYFNERDVDHERDFCDRFPNGRITNYGNVLNDKL